MGILERLLPQPRWKHADPAVRAAAVFDLPPEEAGALLTLAREDADRRVRRAAATRVDDVGVLAEIAATDPDEEVRAEAIRGLAGLAAESDDVHRGLEAVRQLIALGRFREAVIVARDSSSPDVRAAIVNLLDDPKSLGSISRQAQDGVTRLRALGRLNDADEILNVALKSAHTDVALGALDRVVLHEGISAIAQRARNKVAARRARTRLRALEDAAQPAPAEPGHQMNPADAQRALALIQTVESIVAVADPAEASAKLAEGRMGWAEFQADVDIVDPELVQRFDSACEAVREAVAERELERAEEQERARLLAQEQADRLAICTELEGASGADAADRVAELKVAWDALPPMPSEYAASLTRRFLNASRAFEEAERRRVLAAAAAGRLETLAAELERLVASDQPVEEVVARWRGLRRDAEVLREHASVNPEAAERVTQAVAQLEEKEQEHERIRERQEQDNLRRLERICRQVETLAAAGQITLKAGDRALRDIRAASEDRTQLPSKSERQAIQARLETARKILAPRVQELRDADEWQRWANVQVQEELCAAMEALKTEENLDAAGRKMRDIQARWKQVALAPRAQGEALWRRFKSAQDEVFARTVAHLTAQNEERVANLARKQELCERAEALADSTDWVKTATEIQGLQAKWKTIGPVNRGNEKAIWERFRAACDRFFTRRQEDLKHRKNEWAANLARKEALCRTAEELEGSTDWDNGVTRLKQLQSEWKTIGPVRKAKSEAVWQRFRTACDRFFERYKHRDQVDLQAKMAPRHAIIGELEALLPEAGAVGGQTPEQLGATVRDARTRWQQAPELPRVVLQDLTARYNDVLGRLASALPAAFAGTNLDPAATRKRMEKLLARIEELASGQTAAAAAEAPALSPAEVLARQWRERLAANTMKSAMTSVDTEESRWRTAEQEVRSAQAQWARLGPMPAEVAGPLNERFQRACRRFYEQRRKAS